jgi:hypothetical protein
MPARLMTALLVLLAAAVAWALLRRYALGFLAQRPRDYAGTAPAFDLGRHLAGPMRCEGVIYGPTGRVSTRFVAEMTGAWDETGGRLAESFRYASGGVQQREWRITPGAGGRFTARAEDVQGEATGETCGATAVMRYRLRLPREAGGWLLHVTDWLYLTEDGVILNRSQFRLYGLPVGELVACIRPAGA